MKTFTLKKVRVAKGNMLRSTVLNIIFFRDSIDNFHIEESQLGTGLPIQLGGKEQIRKGTEGGLAKGWMFRNSVLEMFKDKR